MHPHHEVFISALELREKVRLTFFSKEDSQHLVRVCAPMDFGPSRRTHDQSDRYHFWDYDSDRGRHTLSLLSNQVIEIRAVGEPGFVESVVWNRPAVVVG